MYWEDKRDAKGTRTESNNTNKTDHSKITQENSANKLVENAERQSNNRKPRKQNSFGVGYNKIKNITK